MLISTPKYLYHIWEIPCIKKKHHLMDANDALLSTDRKNLIGSEKKLMIRLTKNRLY